MLIKIFSDSANISIAKEAEPQILLMCLDMVRCLSIETMGEDVRENRILTKVLKCYITVLFSPVRLNAPCMALLRH
jgi:hypothetical protein